MQDVVVPEIIKNVKENSLSKIEKEYQEKIEELKKPSTTKRYFVFIGLVIGLLFLASLVANQIITGSIALIVGFVAVVLTIYGIKVLKNLDPVIERKLKNQQMKMLIEEAQKRTIETISNYVLALEEYNNYVKKLRNKVDALIAKYEDKLRNTKDDYLKKEYEKLLNKLIKAKEAIEVIERNSAKKKEEFEKRLKIAREKYEFTKETKDIVNFLEKYADSSLDKMLVDTSLSTLDKEFNEITASIENLARDLGDVD
ncbi:MAG: hypothetical protein ABGX23_00500 [Nautiliaceae bacterium]